MNYISSLLSFLPAKTLESFAVKTGVNKFSKKLQGELLFKLLFYCIATEKDNSLRGMQSALESSLFRAISPSNSATSIAHSSISDRLNTIRYKYFEDIFLLSVKKYKSSLNVLQKQIVRFDSTIVALSGKLLNIGYQIKGSAAEKCKMLKFTIGYSDIPDCICFYTEQTYTSENSALKEAILSNEIITTQAINVFDRGISSRAHYDVMTDKGILYISRVEPNATHTILTGNTLKKSIDTESLTILSDTWVYLYAQHSIKSKHPVRIIHGLKKSDGEKISFITNIRKIKTEEIAGIYKSRWQIEIFFKFIKQHLNFNHLLNRSENGIKVVMYVTMITAILIAQYKNINNLKGYKIVKRKFVQDLETDIIYNIVILCGGDAKKAKKLLYKKSP
jgi:Transposase DDE domain